MNSSQIVKKRLVDLKKLSEQLKQSTEIQEYPNISLVKAIIDITKDYNPKNPSKYQSAMPSPKSSTGQNSLIHKLSFLMSKNQSNRQSVAQKQLQAQNQHGNGEYQPLFPENHTKQKKLQMHKTESRFFKKSPKMMQQQNEQDQQLINLRQQNVDLQHKLNQMRKQLNHYKAMNSQNQSPKTPYFQIQQNLQIFMTKIRINQKDYSNIQYIGSKVKLTIDKLFVQKNRGRNLKWSRSVQSQQNDDSDDEMNSDVWKLQLDELVSVQYLNGSSATEGSMNRSKKINMQPGMLLTFVHEQQQKQENHDDEQQDEQQTISLFIKFHNQQHLHRWDLGIYINYKLINSVNKKQLFMQQTRVSKQQQQLIVFGSNQLNLSASASGSTIGIESKDINNLAYKDILKDYLAKKQMYVEAQKLLKSKMIQRISEQKTKNQNKRQASQTGSVKYHSQAGNHDFSKSKNIFTGFIDDINSDNKEKNDKKENIKQEQQQEQQQQKNQFLPISMQSNNKKQQIVQQNERKKNTKGGTQALKPNKQQQIRDQSVNNKEEKQQKDNKGQKTEQKNQQKKEVKKSQQEIKKQQKQKQQQQKRKIIQLEQKIKQQKAKQEQQQYKFAIQWLKNGIFMTKYAKGGYSPHQKKVFINQEVNKLCWQERDTKQTPKTINLLDIVQISQGEIGPGIEKHVKKNNISNKMCYIVIHCASGKKQQKKIIQFGSKNDTLVTQFSNKLGLVMQKIKGIKK